MKSLQWISLLAFIVPLQACKTQGGNNTPVPAPDDTSPPIVSGFSLTQAIPLNSVSNPTDLAFVPGGSGDMLVLGQSGTVHYFSGGVLKNSIDISSSATAIGVVDGGEQGLLNIEFHPDYASNHFVFFYHTSVASTVNSISRMTLSFSGGTMGLSDPVKIIDMRKDTSAAASNHNGGGMVFAPDKTLIASVGDGGAVSSKAQSDKTLLGKVLRINPSVLAGVGGYSTVSGNMFGATNAPCTNVVASATACPEILAMGLRNPYRLAIDGDVLYLGDVGSGTEEVNAFAYNSGNSINFGWPTHDGHVSSSAISAYRNPILYYSRSDSTADRFRSEDPQGEKTGYASVIIGDVYRGTVYGNAVNGHLLHAEFMDGFIRAQGVDAAGALLGTGLHLAHHDGVSAMKQGLDGYIYIVVQGGAWGTTGPDMVYRLDPVR